MNYYPNYYSGTAYPQYPYQPQPQPSTPFFSSGLNGKIVDSADIVKVTEVPVGSYGVFPKADMSEVYIKTWGQDGTTQILTYKPTVPIQPADLSTQLLERIDVLEQKIDNIILQTEHKEVQTNVKPNSNETAPKF